MNSELLPCPFCGGEAYETSPEQNGSFFWRITCQHCYARIAGTHRTMNREAWNTRAERTCNNVAATPEDTFTCSCCGVTLHLDHDFLGYGTPIVDYTRGYMDDNPLPIKNNNYCPNCGAKVVDE